MGLCSNWSNDAALPETCDTTEVEPTVLASAHAVASEVLYNLTQRKYPGVCTDTFYPFACEGCWAAGCRWTPVLVHGAVTNCALDPCHHGILLPGHPVISITSVTVDGVALAAADYRLWDNRLLVRSDGTYWPCSSTCDPYDDATQFRVVYTWGRSPTAALVKAAGRLAWEFALAWTPSCAGRCQLPARVQTVTRQGVSYTILDPLTLFSDGLTGISEVDLIVQAHLRGEARQRAMVAVPGARPAGTRA